MNTLFGTIDQNGTVTKNFETDLHSIPSKDPLAFAGGINFGISQRKKTGIINHGLKHSELSQEYLRGFLYGYKGILIPEGTKIKKGQEQNFSLLHLDQRKKEG
jgi:hypothetical protein